jgi:hypothetical protein
VAQCRATPIEFDSPHEAICAGFVDICLSIFHSYCLPSQIPDACHSWGGYGWHMHIQAFQTPPSTRCVPNGRVGPRPSPKPITLACLQRALFIQTCVKCVFARWLSKNSTRACGVNFRALFTHPQTKPRALNTAPTPPNPLQKAPQNMVMWNTK